MKKGIKEAKPSTSKQKERKIKINGERTYLIKKQKVAIDVCLKERKKVFK